jgi:hypothetical protein
MIEGRNFTPLHICTKQIFVITCEYVQLVEYEHFIP